ncbi:MAG: cytochrome c3 family protein [Vicinamibacterales bacterium]|nr:cytochrome c3 family protein [Vicinamibacterales bacterium]
MMRLVLALFVVALATPAAAQTSRCADCHLANAESPTVNWSAFASRHLSDWDHSPHQRANVGCEKCHGGDATTFERFQAHQGMLNSRNPASPVHPANLPATCGTCHTGPFVAFQKSHHFELLKAGNNAVPTCSTCHGEVGANLLSPRALQNACATCHGPRSAQPRPERATDAGILMTGVREVRATLDEARSLIRRVKDPARRTALETQWQQAEVPLIEAAQAGHEFIFTNLRERLNTARTRAEALMVTLANQ